MPKIISLEKKKRLYKVVFDNDQTIYVTEDTIVRFFLSKGASFDLPEIDKIVAFADFSRGKNLGLYYISFKQRTKKRWLPTSLIMISLTFRLLKSSMS